MWDDFGLFLRSTAAYFRTGTHTGTAGKKSTRRAERHKVRIQLSWRNLTIAILVMLGLVPPHLMRDTRQASAENIPEALTNNCAVRNSEPQCSFPRIGNIGVLNLGSGKIIMENNRFYNYEPPASGHP